MQDIQIEETNEIGDGQARRSLSFKASQEFELYSQSNGEPENCFMQGNAIISFLFIAGQVVCGRDRAMEEDKPGLGSIMKIQLI